MARNAKSAGKYGQAAQDEQIPAPFALLFVVGAGVHQIALYRAQIFLPLVFNVDQRPLPAAENEML